MKLIKIDVIILMNFYYSMETSRHYLILKKKPFPDIVEELQVYTTKRPFNRGKKVWPAMPLGPCRLCWHNFENNRYVENQRIILRIIGMLRIRECYFIYSGNISGILQNNGITF